VERAVLAKEAAMQQRLFQVPGRMLIGLVCAAASAACTSALDVDDAAAATVSNKQEGAVVIGDVDWQEASLLPEGTAERANASAVAYLDLPAAGSRCTGFLITPDVLLTNHHCVPDASAARGARAFFRYESGVAGDTPVDCSTFVGNDLTLDFALLQCAGRPGDTFGTVSLTARAARRGEAVYVIHQNCDYYSAPSCLPTKKLSAGSALGVDVEISHDADTLGGSSGSPLFARDTHEVVGLHHVGLGNDGRGRGTMNRAVAMSRIVPVLQQRYPGLVLGGSAPVTTTPATPPTTDAYEPNDTFGGSTSVAVPFASLGARIDANDMDIYALVADGAPRSFTLRFTHAQGDLDLYVYDVAGSVIARSVGVTDVEQIDGAFTGPVRVVVLGYGGATGAYTLTLR
jgi:hypothetical protein